MAIKKSTLTLALGTAFAASLTASPVVNAAQNPFAMQSLDKGYMVADAGDKAKDGKCGGNKETKAKDGKCGASKDAKAVEAKCGGNMEKDAAAGKMKDGKCGNAPKMKDGKCGEAKCGANKPKPEEKK